jgi:transcriptional regulator with XRE-family HTH domain
MAIRTMDVDEFIAFMRKQQGEQTDKQFAESIGVTPQYICDIYNGRRVPGDSITRALGATRKLVYTVPKEGQEK